MSKKSLLVLAGLGLLAACSEPSLGPAIVHNGQNQEQPHPGTCQDPGTSNPPTDQSAARAPECPSR